MPSTRILVVDDEPIVALTLAASLKKLRNDIVVDTAHSFVEAFAHVQQIAYMLLIIDYEMPGLNGLDLARAVGRISPDTRIVLMAARGTQALRDTVELLDLFSYLEKPFTLREIRELLGHVANGRTTVRRVLLMEGHDGLRRLYREALWNAGYKVYEAPSLESARTLLDHRRFDVFLCSLDMDVLRAIDLIREQADRLGHSDTQIIAISAEGGHRGMCEQIGVEFYLETPVATDPLVTLLDRLTEVG